MQWYQVNRSYSVLDDIVPALVQEKYKQALKQERTEQLYQIQVRDVQYETQKRS